MAPPISVLRPPVRCGWEGCVGAALMLAITVSVASAQTTIVLSPVRDTTLFEEGDLSNGGGEYLFTGTTALGARRRMLLAFDLSAIPSGATIDDARLDLTMSRTIAGTLTVRLHRLSADWNEGNVDAPAQEGTGAPASIGDATWVYRRLPSLPWSIAGGDFRSTASASTPVRDVGGYGWTAPNMIADVQNWLDNPSLNQGWILIGNESSGFRTAKRFASREHNDLAQRPRLIVTYSGGQPPPPVTIPTLHWPGAILLILGLGAIATWRRSKTHAIQRGQKRLRNLTPRHAKIKRMAAGGGRAKTAAKLIAGFHYESSRFVRGPKTPYLATCRSVVALRAHGDPNVI